LRPSKPALTLSPRDIDFAIPALKSFLIPWNEVLAVTVRDIQIYVPSTNIACHIRFNDVTAVRVGKASRRIARFAIPIGAIFLVLTNLLGLWQANYQREARTKSEAWQRQLDLWAAEERRSRDEKRKRDADWEEFWRKHRF